MNKKKLIFLMIYYLFKANLGRYLSEDNKNFIGLG